MRRRCALYRGDTAQFGALIAEWPGEIR